MKIQIIGGTRFIGPRVVSQLLNQGHEVCIFHRGQTNSPELSGIKEIKGDRDELEKHLEEFKSFGPDVVLDMFPYLEQDALKIMKVFKGIAKRVVGLSSLDIYRAYERLLNIKEGPIESVPLREDSPLREGLYPLQFLFKETDRLYYYDKKLIETIMMSDPELPGSILRLPQVYGPGDRQHRLFPYLKRMVDNRNYILLGEKHADWKVSRGFVDDIAFGISQVVTMDKATNQIYNIAEQEPLTEYQWVKRIAETAGWSGDIIIVPEKELSDGGNSEQDWFMDTTKIRTDLGYKEISNREIALRDTFNWEKVNYPESYDNDKFDYKKEDEILKKYKLLI